MEGRTTARTRDERVSSGFRENDQMEALLRLKATDHERYLQMPARLRMAVGFYKGQKDAALRERNKA